MNTILSKNIKWLRESKGFTQETFCTKLGFKKADLSNWENAKNKPKLEKLYKIAEFFSFSLEELYSKDLSKSNTFEKKKDNTDVTEEKRNKKKFIPLYGDVGIHVENEQKTSGDTLSKDYVEMIDAGDLFSDAAAAMLIYDDSMYPKYPAGSIILFKEVFDKDFFVFGKDYLIETDEYRIVKRVQKSNKAKHIMLCSYNEKMDVKGNLIYESMDVPMDKIKRFYKIVGKAERNESNIIGG